MALAKNRFSVFTSGDGVIGVIDSLSVMVMPFSCCLDRLASGRSSSLLMAGAMGWNAPPAVVDPSGTCQLPGVPSDGRFDALAWRGVDGIGNLVA